MDETIFDKNKLNLVSQVKERVSRPVNVSVTQAMIESFGIREVDVSTDYGFETIELLAEFVHSKIHNEIRHSQSLKAVNNNKIWYSNDYFFVESKVFFKHFFVGTYHLLPIFLQIVSIVLFGFSLWTDREFNILQSTSVVLGVITAFVFTGGTVTVISKQISFFWNHKNEEMVLKGSIYLLKKGFRFLLLMDLLFLLIAVSFGLFALEMMILSSFYSLFIGSILLIAAPLYVIKKRNTITLSILIGTVVTVLFKNIFELHVYLCHLLGIFIAVVILIIGLLRYFKQKNILSKELFTTHEVSPSFMFYNNFIYFFYGTFFYFFIFLDRILAWSVLKNERFSYFIFFEKDYEIGMDLAILSYLLAAGFMEYCISRFTSLLDELQNKIGGVNFKEYNFVFKKVYQKNIRLLIMTFLFSFVVQMLMIFSSYGYRFQFDEQLNSMNIQICLIGSLGYFFLSWGVLNILYFFTLGYPKKAFESLLIGLGSNFLVGLLMSRLFSYHLSVVGLFVGSLIFMIYSTNQILKYFKSMDYYYYAAY